MQYRVFYVQAERKSQTINARSIKEAIWTLLRTTTRSRPTAYVIPTVAIQVRRHAPTRTVKHAPPRPQLPQQP